MSTLSNLLKRDQHYLVLMVLLAVFVILDVNVPAPVAELVNTLPGKIVVVVAALSLCATKQPILSALALVAAYELISRSSNGMSVQAVKYLPTEAKKSRHLSVMNQFPITVEEQVIAEMIPKESAPIMSSASYKPRQDKLYDAAKLN